MSKMKITRELQIPFSEILSEMRKGYDFPKNHLSSLFVVSSAANSDDFKLLVDATLCIRWEEEEKVCQERAASDKDRL